MPIRRALTSLVPLALAMIASAAEPGVRYFEDSSSERRPAITAFPDYPSVARRDRIEGDATVCFRIDDSGRVKSAKVDSYTHKIFRRPALRAIRKSTFEPLQHGEIASKEKVCRTYRFRLEPIERTDTDDDQ